MNDIFEEHAGKLGAAFGVAIIGVWYIVAPFVEPIVDAVPALLSSVF